MSPTTPRTAMSRVVFRIGPVVPEMLALLALPGADQPKQDAPPAAGESRPEPLDRDRPGKDGPRGDGPVDRLLGVQLRPGRLRPLARRLLGRRVGDSRRGLPGDEGSRRQHREGPSPTGQVHDRAGPDRRDQSRAPGQTRAVCRENRPLSRRRGPGLPPQTWAATTKGCAGWYDPWRNLPAGTFRRGSGRPSPRSARTVRPSSATI